MAVSAHLYGKACLSMLNKEIDWAADTLKVMLCTSTYAPDQDTHDYQSDVTNEVSNVGTGYTTGGNAIGTPTVGYTAGSNVAKFSGDAVTFTAVTLTARYAVIYDSTPGAAATNPLIAWVDFGADVSPVAGDLVITWNASGIFTMTVAA
jgi:hypothetical protein